MKNYILTKTKITSGLQCQKKLWFDFHDPIDEDNAINELSNNKVMTRILLFILSTFLLFFCS